MLQAPQVKWSHALNGCDFWVRKGSAQELEGESCKQGKNGFFLLSQVLTNFWMCAIPSSFIHI